MIRRAASLIRAVEDRVECEWCKSHIRLVRNAIGDLEVFAKLEHALKDNPDLLKWLRLLASREITFKVFALLARIVLFLKKLR